MKIDIKYVKRTMVVAVTSCLFAVSICIGQDFMGNVMDVVDRHMDSHRYLEALQETREYPVSPEFPNGLEVQMQLMFSSFLGQNHYYSELIEAWADNLKLSDSLRNIVLGSAYQDDEAIGKMVELAKDKQIVMINEMHFLSTSPALGDGPAHPLAGVGIHLLCPRDFSRRAGYRVE